MINKAVGKPAAAANKRDGKMKLQKIGVAVKNPNDLEFVSNLKAGDLIYSYDFSLEMIDRFVIAEVLPANGKYHYRFMVGKINRIYHTHTGLIAQFKGI